MLSNLETDRIINMMDTSDGEYHSEIQRLLLNVNDSMIEFEYDTGSWLTLINAHKYREIFGNVKLKPLRFEKVEHGRN